MSWRNFGFKYHSFNSFFLQKIEVVEIVKWVAIEPEIDTSPTPPEDETIIATPPPVEYEQEVEYTTQLTHLGRVIVHVNGTSDDYKFENSGNKLILTSTDNKYNVSNFDDIVFFGLNTKEKEYEATTGIKIQPSTRLTSDSTSMFKSCIRRELMGGDILDRAPSLLCEIIG